MDPALMDNEIIDMLNTTLYKMGRNRFEMIATDLQEYIVMGQILTKRGGTKTQRSGIGIEETLMVNVGGYSKLVGLHDEDQIVIKDFLTKMKLTWAHLTDNMAWERRELLENRGEERVNNVLVPRRTAMMIRVAKTLEREFWGVPDLSDKKKPWGIRYWLTRNSSTGFNGGAYSGNTVAGVDLTTVGDKFKNYTFDYTYVSKDDLIKKLRTAHRKTHWKSPVNKKEFRGETGQRRKLYLNEATISAYEEAVESQNDNLGRDAAPYDDETVFKKHPLQYVPYLDSDTQNPIYMIDLATIHPVVLAGDYLRRSPAQKHPNQHNTFVSFVDLSWNFICVNRRANCVGAQLP